ncbi:MAG: type II secretion system F family protein [Candidatus Omnitrophota bacterium]|nr:type II secretion system F family protein [Candidatus Omnitrophota bacterium]
MRFIYKAKKGPHEVIEGAIEAVSRDAAVGKIRQMNLVPIALKEDVSVPARKEAKKTIKLAAGGGKVSKKNIFMFTKKLRVLLKSQEPLLKSLYFLEDQVDSHQFKAMIRAIAESVREGLGFSESLSKFPKLFSPLYVSIIQAGEASGNLDNSLEEISKYLENERQLSQKVMASLAYPSVMITVGAATIIFIITFVVPKMKSLFEDLADRLPLATRILLDVSEFFSHYWIFMFAAAIAGSIFLMYTREAEWQKNIIAQIKKRIPVVKDIIYNQSLCRFAGGVSILLSSGVSLLDSIRISIPLIEDDKGREELEDACQQIVAGAGLEESLSDNCRYLPDMFIKMVAVGEASGRLDEILRELSDSYRDEVETTTKVVTSLIEPMAILIVGGILGFIVIAVLLPIFEMSLFVQ